MTPRETNIKTIPPRPKRRGLIGFAAGLLLGSLIFIGWRSTLPAEQSRCLKEYVRQTVKCSVNLGSLRETTGRKTTVSRAQFIHDWLKNAVYEGEEPWVFARWPLGMTAALAFGLAILGNRMDHRMMRQLRAGRKIDGRDVDTRARFNRRVRESGDALGIGFIVKNRRTVGERVRGRDGRVIYIGRRSETQHILMSGATGSGKTQGIMQILDQVQDRPDSDTAIVWDPTGVLLKRYFHAERGDVVLNPLDARCPSWCPTWELDHMSKAMAEAAGQAMGTSLYVGRASASDSDKFFTDAAIAIWKHLLVHAQPSEAQELAYWMANAKPEIDERVRGTKLEQDLDPGSTPQRNGIISTFTRVEQALTAIPTSDDAPRWTVRDWCAKRKGWLFLTTTADTADALRPIQSLWLDMLIRQLMSQGERPDLRSPWFCFDELAALQRLPMLQSGLSEGRKFDLRFVLGFQAMSQVEWLYGKETAQTILAAPKTQFYLRTGEAGAAEWMSRQCGEQRIEELRETFPASWAGGNGNRTVSTAVVDRRIYIASVFMGLKDLHGIMGHENSLVKVEFPYLARVERAPAFIPRKDPPLPMSDEWAPEPTGTVGPETHPEPEPVSVTPATESGRGGVFAPVGLTIPED